LNDAKSTNADTKCVRARRGRRIGYERVEEKTRTRSRRDHDLADDDCMVGLEFRRDPPLEKDHETLMDGGVPEARTMEILCGGLSTKCSHS